MGKGRRERSLPFGRKAGEALDRYLRARARHKHAELPWLWLGQQGRLTDSGLERANLEAARLADAQVASEHVLLALISHGHFPPGWIARSGITADAIRQRVLDATEGIVVPDVAPLEPPPPTQAPWAHAPDLAPNPLGHDPHRRHPWGSRGFGMPLGRPPKRGGWAGQYFIDRDGYPVLTIDGQPVHFVVDEHTVPVLTNTATPCSAQSRSQTAPS